MLRDDVWDMVYSIIDDKFQDRICLYEGVQKYEVDVQDIVESVEDLADKIETKIKEDDNDER